MRHCLKVMAVAISVMFLGCSAPPEKIVSEEKKVAVPGHGTLTMDVPGNWNFNVQQVQETLPPTITIKPQKDPGAFSASITPFWDHLKKEDFNSISSIKQMVKVQGTHILPQFKEKNLEIKTHESNSGIAVFYSLTANKPDKKDQRFLTQGGTGTGDLLLMFTVITRENNPALVRDVMDMALSGRQEGE